jgi:lipopolysaccharide exporter
MLLARVLDRVLGFVSTVVLARLLLPEDFGLVAMATAIIAVLDILRAFGFDVALIQNPNATRSHYDTAWTCNVLLGLVIGAAVAAVAAPAAAFYDEPRLTWVMVWLAVSAFVTGLENVGVIAFRKDLQFHKEFNLLLAKRVVTFCIAIPLAVTLRNYWALVAGVLVGRVCSVALTYLLHPYRPRFSLAERRQLFHFGKWLVASTVLNVLSTRSGDFLIGKISGAHALGVYNISNELASLPTSDLVAPINRAMLPGYAQKAAHRTALAASYVDVSGLIALLAVPAALGISAVANVLVPVVLGPNWDDAAAVIAILSAFGMLIAVKSNTHYVYLATGKPRLATWVGFLQIVLLLPMLVVGSLRAGATGAAFGCLLAEILFTPISFWILRNELHLRHWDVYRPLLRPLIAGVLMYIVTKLVADGFVASQGGLWLLAGLLGCVLLGAVVYVGAMLALWLAVGKPATAERHVLDFATEKLLPRIRALRPASR